jgi:hypothetical protein
MSVKKQHYSLLGYHFACKDKKKRGERQENPRKNTVSYFIFLFALS